MTGMACEHKQLICSRKFSDIATSIVSGRLTITCPLRKHALLVYVPGLLHWHHPPKDSHIFSLLAAWKLNHIKKTITKKFDLRKREQILVPEWLHVIPPAQHKHTLACLNLLMNKKWPFNWRQIIKTRHAKYS